MHPDAFSCITDAKHGNAFAGDETALAQVLQGVAATVVTGDHAEAGGTAVHSV